MWAGSACAKVAGCCKSGRLPRCNAGRRVKSVEYPPAAASLQNRGAARCEDDPDGPEDPFRQCRNGRLAQGSTKAYLCWWRVLLFACWAHFPVADKQTNGGWLCPDPGPGIWRPPETSGSREKPGPHGCCGPATFSALRVLVPATSRSARPLGLGPQPPSPSRERRTAQRRTRCH